jgi:dihydroorotate dehydrogenase
LGQTVPLGLASGCSDHASAASIVIDLDAGAVEVGDEPWQ